MENYKKYREQLEAMGEPVKAEDIPNIQIDLPAMVAYAKKNGKTVLELTEEERAIFTQAYTNVSAAATE